MQKLASVDKIFIFAVLERCLLQLKETDSSFVLIIFAVLLGKIARVAYANLTHAVCNTKLSHVFDVVCSLV